MGRFFPIKGIRRRWLVNGLGISVLVILLSVLLFSVLIRNYYYSSMRQGLLARATTNNRYITTYFNLDSESFYSFSSRLAADFADKNVLEFQMIDAYGRVLSSSSGLPKGSIPAGDDVQRALIDGTPQVFLGRDPLTGERIMAASAPLVVGNNEIGGGSRYVTALSIVDRRIRAMILIAVGLGLLMLGFVTLSGRYFLRSIVGPVNEIGETTKKISKGSYGIRIQRHFPDEIGELAEMINEMSAELAKAERMKNDFISSVSHELRTPLTAIIGWAETLCSGGAENPDEARRGVGVILKETRRLSKMVEDLLDFARMEGGRVKMRMEPFDLGKEIEEVLFMYAERCRREQVSITYQAAESEVRITADRERIAQVVHNLLDNALKHGRDGGRVHVTVRADAENAILSVRDFGAGISPEEIGLVKEKFHKASTRAPGSGIGLAVCEEIARLHEGRLDIESEGEGKGVAATLTLPLRTE